jgi:hypothetical protein
VPDAWQAQTEAGHVPLNAWARDSPGRTPGSGGLGRGRSGAARLLALGGVSRERRSGSATSASGARSPLRCRPAPACKPGVGSASSSRRFKLGCSKGLLPAGGTTATCLSCIRTERLFKGQKCRHAGAQLSTRTSSGSSDYIYTQESALQRIGLADTRHISYRRESTRSGHVITNKGLRETPATSWDLGSFESRSQPLRAVQVQGTKNRRISCAHTARRTFGGQAAGGATQAAVRVGDGVADARGAPWRGCALRRGRP